LIFYILAALRDFAIEIFLHDEAADRHTKRGAESGILDVDADRNLRLIVRSETDERRVVFPVRVLCGTGFTGDLDITERSAAVAF
jgi:hypothetical protein